MWAELAHQENLTSEAEFAMVRTMIWAVEVESAWIADYGTFKAASDAGFDPAALLRTTTLHARQKPRDSKSGDFRA